MSSTVKDNIDGLAAEEDGFQSTDITVYPLYTVEPRDKDRYWVCSSNTIYNSCAGLHLHNILYTLLTRH